MCGPVQRVKFHHDRWVGPCICVIRPRDLASEPEPAAFGSYDCLEVFIYLSFFMLARLILVLRWIGSESKPHQKRCVLI